MSTADYQREWRARHGARTGKIGRPVTQPCGTTAAYRRHLRHNEPPCQPCKDAWAEQARDRYTRRQR